MILKIKFEDEVHSIKVNSFLNLEEQPTPKIDVDQAISGAIDGSSLIGLDPYGKVQLDERGCILLNFTLTSLQTILEIPTENYIEYKYDDPSITKSTTHVDFNDKSHVNVRFVKINRMPAVREHLPPKSCVSQAISYWLDDLSLLRLDAEEKLYLDEQDSIFFQF